MRDPYDVLGVPRNADAAAIKGAFRTLAKKLHPDANKNDPKAAQRFAEINSAYEILGEDERRKAFDRGEIDADGKPRFRGFEGFARNRGAGGPAGRGAAEFGFEQFSFGPEGARHFGGRGGGFANVEEVLNSVLGGMAGGQRGRAGANFRAGFAAGDVDERASPDVTVAVTISLEEAAKGGTKRVGLPSGKEVDVKFPAGLAEGRQIRLKGRGSAGNAGPGDVLITIRIAPHPLFKLDGADLRLELPITLYEAVLGGKVRVPTLDGAVDLAIPPGISSARTFRIPGRGMPAEAKTGDLYVTLRITLPDKADHRLDELMREWRDKKPYNPRRDLP
jgi:DnaJ-class molecular chaperone